MEYNTKLFKYYVYTLYSTFYNKSFIKLTYSNRCTQILILKYNIL